MRKYLISLLVLICTPALAEDAAPPPNDAPQWYIDEVYALTADGGRWITDNSAYKSENEPFEAYGMEWRKGFDGKTMTGRLFALKDGVETVNFWEFRQYWHPGKKEAVLEQFGWGGAVGIGPSAPDENGVMVGDQMFYRVDGSSERVGHRSAFPDPDTHTTDSFDIVDGEWRPRRQYVWKREKVEADDAVNDAEDKK